MPDSKALAKAKLAEMDSDLKKPLPGGKTTTVQFNPETLKVTFSNSLQQKAGQENQTGTPSMLFVGGGTMKLSLTLWFDAGSPVPEGATGDNRSAVSDVTDLTREVIYFVTPKPAEDPKTHEKGFITPPVKLTWGTFTFIGVVESLEQSIEYFSPDGRPLRASIALGISAQKIQEFERGSTPGLPSPRGVRPLVPALANQSLQSLAAAAGLAGNWQAIAAANGIENPRLLPAGALIDLRASANVSASGSISASVSGSATIG